MNPSHRERPRSHRDRSHTGSTLTQGPHSHRDFAHTGGTLTQGACSHRDSAYTGSTLTQETRSNRERAHTGTRLHRERAYTGTVLPQGVRSHRDLAHTGSALTQGSLSLIWRSAPYLASISRPPYLLHHLSEGGRRSRAAIKNTPQHIHLLPHVLHTFSLFLSILLATICLHSSSPPLIATLSPLRATFLHLCFSGALIIWRSSLSHCKQNQQQQANNGGGATQQQM